MHRSFFTAAAACAVMALPAPAVAQAPRPDAVAPVDGAIGRLFEAWLTAFNSGDTAAIKAFYRTHLGDDNPLFALENAQDSCGFDLERVEARSPSTLTVLLRQRCLPGLQRATLAMAADGAKLESLSFRPLPLPGEGANEVTATIASRLAARDEFAGALIVVRGGRPLLARSWGLADPAAGTAMTLDTPMFLASAGKMFTAVAILQLVESGRVALDAPVGRYLTDYPNPEMAKVTIRQLLTHRGGTGDIGILARDEGANRARVRTTADIVRLNGARAPDFAPGTKEDYSNYGFVLLGAVIEKVTGSRYHDVVARRVFARAGMTRSGFPTRARLKGVAVGYTTFYGAEPKRVANTDVLPWRGTAAGGGVSTANDMARFFDAMKAGKLLSPEMVKLATSAGDTPWYGLGFVVDPGRSWGHGGMSYGMDVAAHHYVPNDTTFICMATRDMVCNRLIFAWNLRTFAPDDQP